MPLLRKMGPLKASTKARPVEGVRIKPADVAKAEAEQLAEDYLTEILDYSPQARYEDIIKHKGFILDDPLTEALLFGGGAMLLGGGAVKATDNNDDELTVEQMQALQALGY